MKSLLSKDFIGVATTQKVVTTETKNVINS